MAQTVKFTKVRDVKSPVRGTGQAAGIDFFVPNYSPSFLVDLIKKNPFVGCSIEDDTMYIVIPANGRVLIPSGIKTFMDPDTALIGANKSGVSSKKGLVFGAHVIDSDYSGEVHINVINTSDTDVIVTCGEKLIQFIHTPVILSTLEEVGYVEYETLHANSVRGEGGFGSTGSH
jgi:dUTP pyrophosphatase